MSTNSVTTAALAGVLPKCRTFNPDGGPICEEPARYIVWGHLFAKQHKGPKCYRHLPPECKQFRPGVNGGAVFDLVEFATAALEARPLSWQEGDRQTRAGHDLPPRKGAPA